MSHLLGVRASIINLMCLGLCLGAMDQLNTLRWQRTTFITFHFWLWCSPWLFLVFCRALLIMSSMHPCLLFFTTNGRNLAGLWRLRHTPVASCKVYPGGCHLDRRYWWIPFSLLKMGLWKVATTVDEGELLSNAVFTARSFVQSNDLGERSERDWDFTDWAASYAWSVACHQKRKWFWYILIWGMLKPGRPFLASFCWWIGINSASFNCPVF